LLRKDDEILLPALQGGHLLTRGALEIHTEPDRPNEKADHTGRDILGDLRTLVAGEILDLLVIRLNLGNDCCTIGETVLGLNDRDGLRRSSSAGVQGHHHRRAACSQHRGFHLFLALFSLPLNSHQHD
jgi:hypothetical protein